MNKQNILLIIVGLAVVVAIIIFTLLFFRGKQPSLPALPEGWSYQHSDLCSIDIPMPPKADPYISQQGEYWLFQERTQEGVGQFAPGVASVMFRNPALGSSGNVVGAVIVSCLANPEKSSAKEFAQKYQQYLTQVNSGQPAEAQINLNIVREEKMWGKDAVVVSLSGGAFNQNDELYVVTTDKMAYLVSKSQGSQDSFVKATTDQIFENIAFK